MKTNKQDQLAYSLYVITCLISPATNFITVVAMSTRSFLSSRALLVRFASATWYAMNLNASKALFPTLPTLRQQQE